MSGLPEFEGTGCGWFVVAVASGCAGAELPMSEADAGTGDGAASCGSIEFVAISAVSCKVLACELAVAGFVVAVSANARIVEESNAVLTACTFRGACCAAVSMEYAYGTSDAGCSEVKAEDVAAEADVWAGVWTRGVWMSGVGSALA